MIKHADHFHGSDLEKIEQFYDIKKEDIISFAANVNPLGISPKLKQTLSNRIEAIMSYPDREYSSLRSCIASYVHSDMEHIIVGNGSTELISLVIQITNPKKALLLSPTYSEYEREITLNGGTIEYYPLEAKNQFMLDLNHLETKLCEDIDLFILCNPNNPTSSAINTKQMDRILSLCKEKNILVMVDETYVEFVEELDKITSISLLPNYDNLIVLRGISKFFAAPGLRLGYALCSNQTLLREIDRRKNPWTINSLAAIAGEIMFTDDEYIQQTRTLIANERDRIYSLLSQNPNLHPYPPTANFILVEVKKEGITASQIFETCIKDGLMIRNCSNFPYLDERFFRFCFMNPEDNNRLLDIIESIVK